MPVKDIKLTNSVIVIKGKLRRKKKDLIKEIVKYDNSLDFDKPRNPLTFTPQSYAKGFKMVPLWSNLPIMAAHISNLFGEPTRFVGETIEWVGKIGSGECLKLVIDNKGVSLYGFTKNANIEKFYNRLLAS